VKTVSRSTFAAMRSHWPDGMCAPSYAVRWRDAREFLEAAQTSLAFDQFAISDAKKGIEWATRLLEGAEEVVSAR
jgi:hypothetical protein